MKKMLILAFLACSIVSHAQDSTRVVNEFKSSSKPTHKILLFCDTVPSGDKIKRDFVKFNAMQPAIEPDIQLYTIVSYQLQFNGNYFDGIGAEKTEEIKKAIKRAPRNTKISGLFKVIDQNGVVRIVGGTWRL